MKINAVEKEISVIDDSGETDYPHAEEYQVHISHPVLSSNKNGSKCFDIKIEILNLLKDKIGKTLDDIGTIKDLYNRTANVQELIPTINKWDYIK